VSEFDEHVFRRALRSVHWAFGMVWALNAVGGSPHEKGSAATSPWGLIDGMDAKNCCRSPHKEDQPEGLSVHGIHSANSVNTGEHQKYISRPLPQFKRFSVVSYVISLHPSVF
jgi:hypothetical protein